MFEFQNLEVYKKAKSFHAEMKLFIPSIKLDRILKDQPRRATFSIVLNIAEGSGFEGQESIVNEIYINFNDKRVLDKRKQELKKEKIDREIYNENVTK
jgi:hypothetical protein